MALKIGSIAPDFTLKDTNSLDWNFYSEVKNNRCIIYFYPKDFTPGCTTEACGFRDNFGHFINLKIPVVGISTDSIELHQKFKKTYKLPFELLSDTSGRVAAMYGAIIPLVKITKRITYLIDEKKQIAGVYTNFFQAEQHIQSMLEAVKN